MYIRCRRCHGAVWMLEPSQLRTDRERICEQCGAGYRMGILKSFEKSRDRLAGAAREYAQLHCVDLPGAYSVLLGVMTFEELVEVGRELKIAGPVRPASPVEATAKTSTPVRTTTAPTAEFAYDPEYRPSVEQGFLTPVQAIERGSRQAQIRRLVERHDLSEEQAGAVTDNRVSLLAAVRKREKARATHEKITVGWKDPQPSRPYAIAAVTMVATLLVGGFVVHLWLTQVDMARQTRQTTTTRPVVVQQIGDESTAPPEPAVGAPPAGTQVTTDPDRLPLEIRGPTPKSVLLAYCATGAEASYLEPVGLAATLPGQAGLRYGILRDWRNGDEERAIQIQQDHRTRRWFAGNGQRPIAELDLDRLTLDESRVAVYPARR